MIKKYTIPGLLLLAILLTVITILKDQAAAKMNTVDLSDQGFYRFDKPRQLKPVALTNLSGEVVNLAEGNGQWQMINFGYMFCPDICPVNLALMGEVKTQWNSKTDQAPLSITHITFDPQRDTPEKLNPYLNYIDDDLVGFTGEAEEIRKIATQLNTVFIYEKPDEYGNYFITHSDSIALLDPSGNYVGLFKGPYDKDKVISVLEQIIQ